MIKAWLDDTRKPPDSSWTWFKEVGPLQTELIRGNVEEMSLDHDLGVNETGYALVKWMAELSLWSVKKPVVHTANPRGREDMEVTIERYFTERNTNERQGQEHS